MPRYFGSILPLIISDALSSVSIDAGGLRKLECWAGWRAGLKVLEGLSLMEANNTISGPEQL